LETVFGLLPQPELADKFMKRGLLHSNGP